MNKEDIQKIIDEKKTAIITDREYLNKPTEKVEDIKFGEDIAAKLFRVLTENEKGVGLSANQIGIDKNVCVVNVKKPYYFINPRIVEASGEFVYVESCLSFPNEAVRTTRYSTLVIECDNYDGQLYWDVSDIVKNHSHYYMENLDVLECVVIQHEMDHLEGKTMHDRKYIPKQLKSEKKYNRNDKVFISNGQEQIEVKYKKYESQYKDAGYKIVEKVDG